MGRAAPNSAVTSPSQTASSAPAIQPRSACGPPIAAMTSGMVMNGPTPIMSIMFIAVALHRPMPRMRVGDVDDVCAGEFIFAETLLATSSDHEEESCSMLRHYGSLLLAYTHFSFSRIKLELKGLSEAGKLPSSTLTPT